MVTESQLCPECHKRSVKEATNAAKKSVIEERNLDKESAREKVRKEREKAKQLESTARQCTYFKKIFIAGYCFFTKPAKCGHLAYPHHFCLLWDNSLYAQLRKESCDDWKSK